MIDLHTHILPGIDDGPPTLPEALALARATVRAGVSTVVATPHVSPRYPNDPTTMRRALRALRSALAAEGIALTVHPGAELDLERAVSLSDAELLRLRLGSGPYLLLESPLSPLSGDPEPLVRSIQDRGHQILLAHPERSPVFQRDPGQLERLIAHGALTSVTAGAVGGRFGEPARGLAVHLLEEGLAHDLASDMHDDHGRPPGIVEALGDGLTGVFGLEASLDWLTLEVPQAILEGGSLPHGPAVGVRPRPAARRSFWRRRGA